MTTYIKPLIFTLFMFLGTSITAQSDVFLYPLMVCKGSPWMSDHEDINLDNGCGYWEYTSMENLEKRISVMCDTCMYAVQDNEAIANASQRTLNNCTALYNTIAANHKKGIRYRADYGCLYEFKERMVRFNAKKYPSSGVWRMQEGLNRSERPLSKEKELLLYYNDRGEEFFSDYLILDFFKYNTDTSSNPRFERMLYSIVKDSLPVLTEYVRGLERFSINDERLQRAIMVFNSLVLSDRLLCHSLIFNYKNSLHYDIYYLEEALRGIARERSLENSIRSQVCNADTSFLYCDFPFFIIYSNKQKYLLYEALQLSPEKLVNMINLGYCERALAKMRQIEDREEENPNLETRQIRKLEDQQLELIRKQLKIWNDIEHYSLPLNQWTRLISEQDVRGLLLKYWADYMRLSYMNKEDEHDLLGK